MMETVCQKQIRCPEGFVSRFDGKLGAGKEKHKISHSFHSRLPHTRTQGLASGRTKHFQGPFMIPFVFHKSLEPSCRFVTGLNSSCVSHVSPS